MIWLDLCAALPDGLAAKRTNLHKEKIHCLTGHASHRFIEGGIHFLKHGLRIFRGKF